MREFKDYSDLDIARKQVESTHRQLREAQKNGAGREFDEAFEAYEKAQARYTQILYDLYSFYRAA